MFQKQTEGVEGSWEAKIHLSLHQMEVKAAAFGLAEIFDVIERILGPAHWRIQSPRKAKWSKTDYSADELTPLIEEVLAAGTVSTEIGPKRVLSGAGFSLSLLGRFQEGKTFKVNMTVGTAVKGLEDVFHAKFSFDRMSDAVEVALKKVAEAATKSLVCKEGTLSVSNRATYEIDGAPESVLAVFRP